MTTTTATTHLPQISAVDAIDDKLGAAKSDLDVLVSDLERVAGFDAPSPDAVFLALNGISNGDAPYVDPATLARHLVLANDLEQDSDTLREHAASIRRAATSLYHEFVTERAYWRDEEDSRPAAGVVHPSNRT